MNNVTDHELVPITDPTEIEAAQHGKPWDLIAAEVDGQWYAYRWSLERWRAKRAFPSVGTVQP